MMARRVAGVVSVGIAITILLWLVTGASASGFVKSALLAIVSSILVLYKFDELVAKLASRNQPPVVEEEVPTGGVFGTDLPPEAFAEPIAEKRAVNLSRGTQKGDRHSDLLVFPQHEVETKADAPITRLIFTNAEGVDSTEVELAQADGTSGAVVSSEPTFIQLADYSNDDLVASVRAGEASLVSVLTENGMLSSEGALTDTDVATMVFVAVSSDDLLRVLLAGKQAEAEAEALSYPPDTPELYQPAPQLVESES
jgi:hypothetical protein